MGDVTRLERGGPVLYECDVCGAVTDTSCTDKDSCACADCAEERLREAVIAAARDAVEQLGIEERATAVGTFDVQTLLRQLRRVRDALSALDAARGSR